MLPAMPPPVGWCRISSGDAKEGEDPVNNPKISALICLATAAWLGYGLLTASERPSTALLTLQIILLVGCLLGFVGALMRLGEQKGPPRR